MVYKVMLSLSNSYYKKKGKILFPYNGETKFTTMTLHHFSFQEKYYNFLNIVPQKKIFLIIYFFYYLFLMTSTFTFSPLLHFTSNLLLQTGHLHVCFPFFKGSLNTFLHLGHFL